MNRILLALVALLSGLAANTAPAQARIAAASGTEIGALQSPAAVLRSAVAVVCLRTTKTPKNDLAEPRIGSIPTEYPESHVASVQLQADRAHE